MPWAKIDDRLHNHPKALSAGLPALGLHLLALSFCACYLTDGFVPNTWIKARRKLAEKLVLAGLWERAEDGYQIHHYLEYNPSRKDVETERAEARVRMNRTRSSGELNPKFPRSSAAPSLPVPSDTNTPPFIPPTKEWEALREEMGAIGKPIPAVSELEIRSEVGRVYHRQLMRGERA